MTVVVKPLSIEFGAITPGMKGGKMAYIEDCPAYTRVTAIFVGASPYFFVARLVVSYWETQAVDPTELPPNHHPTSPSRHPAPEPTERVLYEDSESNGATSISTHAGAVLSVYFGATIPLDATPGDIYGEILVMGDGVEIARLPAHAFIGGVTLSVDSPISIRQGETALINMTATSIAGPETTVYAALHDGPESNGLTMSSSSTQLPSKLSRTFGGTVSSSLKSDIGPHDVWIIYSAFNGMQGPYDAMDRFLGVPLTIIVTPGKMSAACATNKRLPVIAGGSISIPVNVGMGGAKGQVSVQFTGENLPVGISMWPLSQWIDVIDNKDWVPGTPMNNVDPNGFTQAPITLQIAASFLRGVSQMDVDVWLHWTGYSGAQAGSFPAKITVYSPTAHTTLFVPKVDGYGFPNHWELSTADSETIRQYFGNALDDVMSVCDALIARSLIGVAGITITAVVEAVSPILRNKIHDAILSAPPGTIGLCGGMAFSSLDFYREPMALTDVPHARDNTQPDGSTSLRQYIWQRLLDSLGSNGGRFMEYLVTLHILPGLVGGALGSIVGAAVGGSVVAAGIGAVGGPVGVIAGAVGGAIIGGNTIVIDLGGSKKVMEWSRSEWTKIKSHLDDHEAWPVGLIGDNPNPFESHQVVAIGYDDRGGGHIVDLYIYDNNNPDVIRTISMDLTGDTMQCTTDINDSASWMPLQGIFCEKYSVKIPPKII